STSGRLVLGGGVRTLAAGPPDGRGTFQATIMLRNAAQRELFTVHPIVSIASPNIQTLYFSPVDQQLAADAASGPVSYTITWPMSGRVEYPEPVLEPPNDFDPFDRGFRRIRYNERLYARRWPN